MDNVYLRSTWRVVVGANKNIHHISGIMPSGYSCAIAQTVDSFGGPSLEHRAEIAQLISAAPELRDACNAALPILRALFDEHTAWRDQLRRGETPKPLPAYAGEDDRALQTITMLRAAIAKADGGRGALDMTWGNK